ncbi:hypothetical protein B9Z55_000145 [Caenorhabditis nigoni]|uniref:Uncharacterized protein n=1 Tax=Caenorhabditis nigoni TaxID=1611254 RepID=A0A2G5VFZ8_9PELO|nr:hypothetical protein B9Z55_000145 [Caenorhabditis nigoni]
MEHLQGERVRFRLADRIPKISLAEKAAPLYISKLSIYEEGFELNDTKYRLGVIRKALEGPNPKIIEDDNREGGIEIDIDRFGFENYSLPELTPGDILIKDYRPQMRLGFELVSGGSGRLEELAEERVLESRNRLTDLKRQKMELEQVSEENLANMPMEKGRDQPERRIKVLSQDERLERINQSIRYVKEELEYTEYDLQRYQCKRDNLPSPYDMFIQLTKTSPDGNVYFERVKYDKTLDGARKYLICKFLGNRRVVTKIRSLSFWAHLRGGLVVGLPEGIKLDVREFGTSGNLTEVLQRVETILEHPTRPFTRLKSDGLRLEDAQNPKVQNAGVLVLVNSLDVDVIALCREVPNKKFVVTIGDRIEQGGYAMIVENLINTKGTLGTCYEFNQLSWPTEISARSAIVSRFENAIVEDRSQTMSSTMPDAERKLSYECLKCVIQKLEVNFRFHLAERLPKIRFAEKVVPLYISKLSITGEGFELNDTIYQIGVFRQAREGANPQIIERENQSGGCTRDIDRFGFEKRSLPELTPGDILIEDFDHGPWELTNVLEKEEAKVLASKNTLYLLDREKMELENASEEDLGKYPMEIDLDEESDDSMDAYQLDRSRDRVLRREKRLEEINLRIQYEKSVLEYAELDVQRHQCKRDNLPSPYDMFIQLTKSSPDGTVYIERVHYDKSLWKARKYLICKFLGNRKVVTKIKSLSFWWLHNEGLVIGLPEGIKLDVQEFGTSGNCSEVLQRVEPILEHPNRPFTRLGSNGLRVEDAQNPKVRNAEVLVLDNVFVDCVAVCREVPNKKIVINIGIELELEHFRVLVENLIDTKGTLGTCYEIAVSNEDRARTVQSVIGERFKNSVVRERRSTMSSAIPDADKKLSYDCLKCVIQQFEVNFRFRLAERLPNIRSAEKASPLYISNLSISEGCFQLNHTIYRLGVIRQAREGPTPETIRSENLIGGCPKDIDQFGFKKRSLPELTRGDILIQEYNPAMELNENLELAEARLVRDQRMLANLEREKMELENAPENPAEEILVQPEQLDGRRRRRNQGLTREERLEAINSRIRHTRMSLENAELNVLRFQCKRDNRPLPYDMFIQLTKNSPDSTVHTERLHYYKSLREAQKYLIGKFFGNRQLVTKIKSLGFTALQREGLIIGLPEGVKFDVQEFSSSGNLAEVLQRVETILEHPTRPFSRLSTSGLKLEDAQNPKVRDAGVLVLCSRFANCVALCREVPNKKIEINSGLDMQPEQFGLLVENLINTKGTLGTCFEIFRIMDEGKASDALRFIAGRFENAVVGERLVTIPLPNQLQLDVSYAQSQLFSIIFMYTIKLEVVQSQNN